MSASIGQPIEYSTRRSAAWFWLVSQSMSSWENPAPSMVTSSLLRHRAGTWAIDCLRTAIRSVAVFALALPARSMSAASSPVLEIQQPNGWCPKPWR